MNIRLICYFLAFVIRGRTLEWKSYNVIDYFRLSREVVSLSMLLFDRFFATGIIRPSGDLVLLGELMFPSCSKAQEDSHLR